MQTQFCSVGNIRPATRIRQNEVQQTLEKTNSMKTVHLRISKMATAVMAIFLSITMNAQVNGWNPELESDSKEALNTILEKTPKLVSFKKDAYGYAVFPKITKGAVGVGGAAGNGIVYKDDVALGSTHLKQATFGIQLGGQQYVEVIFFESEEVFEKFTNGKLKFNAQASAVALKSGAAIDAAYQDGVAVFTATKGGLMYEASIGGQHFKYESKETE